MANLDKLRANGIDLFTIQKLKNSLLVKNLIIKK